MLQVCNGRTGFGALDRAPESVHPRAFEKLQDNTLLGTSRQMNHETALGFRLARIWGLLDLRLVTF